MNETTIIQTKMVEKLTISQTGLDPIGVFVEDFKPGQAKVTIEIFGEAWTYYWGSMGPHTLQEFFTDVPYLATKFCRGSIYETDYTAISKRIGEEVDVSTLWYFGTEMSNVYGEDWRMDLPTKPTKEYIYLTRIVEAIQEGFRIQQDAESTQ